MLSYVGENLLGYSVDLELNVYGKIDPLFHILVGGEPPAVLNGVCKQEFESGDKADVLEDRRTEIFANAADLGRNRFDLRAKSSVVRQDLIASDHQVAKIGERLVMEIASDAPAFAFGFVGKIKAGGRKFPVSKSGMWRDV